MQYFNVTYVPLMQETYDFFRLLSGMKLVLIDHQNLHAKMFQVTNDFLIVRKL